MRGEVATSSSSASDQSIGSTELSRRRSTWRFIKQTLDEIDKTTPAFKIAAPAAQIDPAEDHFPIFRREMAHLIDHGIRLRAAAAAAHIRNNAERAAIVASVLNLEIRASAIAERVFNRRGKKVALVENIADANLAVIVRTIGNQIGDRILVRIPNDPGHAGNSRDLFGRALRVAACDDDPCIGLRAMDAADGLAQLIVGGRGDGAGVQDNEVSFGNFVGCTETAGSETGFERSTVSLRSAASERLYEITLQDLILSVPVRIIIARDQACAAIKRHILVAPAQEDQHAIERLGQIHQVNEEPDEPCDKSMQLDAADDSDSGVSADDCQVAFIEIAEWLMALSLQARRRSPKPHSALPAWRPERCRARARRPAHGMPDRRLRKFRDGRGW